MTTIPISPGLRLVQASGEKPAGEPPVAVSRDAAGMIRLNGDAVLRGVALSSGMMPAAVAPKRAVQPARVPAVRSA